MVVITPPYGIYQRICNDQFEAELFMDNHNQRLKIVEYEGDVAKLATSMIELSKQNDLGKIITVVEEGDKAAFLTNGYSLEGTIAGYFKGTDGHCLSYFAKPERGLSILCEQEDRIISQAQEVNGQYRFSPNNKFLFRDAEEADAKPLAELYDTVFKSYPTPMDNPAYIKKVMNQKVLFKVAEIAGQIVSAASADMNQTWLNAEITDCATLPEYRGQGLLSDLIYQLEEGLIEKGYISLFSLSRALSVGVNIVLSKQGYVYSGRQINNCEIMGKFEDMNIWVKMLK